MSNDVAKVFVAGPFSQARDESGTVKGEVRRRLASILGHLRVNGVEAFSAHEREEWGAAIDAPESLVAIDLSALRAASCLIAYLGSVPSLGTSIEIGVAIGLKKRVLILRDSETVVVSDFYQGLVAIGQLEERLWRDDKELELAILAFVRGSGYLS